MSSEAEVLAANEAFYVAFAARDVTAMDSMWAKAAPVACIHPGWDVLLGRDDVMDSWRAILANPGSPRVRCARPTAHVCGETAFVVCVEDVGDSELIATNVFTREAGRWRLVHHQAGPFAKNRERAPREKKPSPKDLN
jgi:ketosteroid isomerase-like protein